MLGTVTRIPAEVLKQRLQARPKPLCSARLSSHARTDFGRQQRVGTLKQVGLHPNAAVALRVAWRETGLPGLFRGTTSLLAREVRTGF